MKFVALGIGLVITAGLLAGCSARSGGQPAEEIEPSATKSPSIAVIEDTDGLVRLNWSDTGKQRAGLPVVSVQNEDCVTPKGVTVQETATTVTVTAWGAKAKEPCSAIGYALAGALPLQSPLGDRKLEHG